MDELTRVLSELQRLERELLEQRYVRRSDDIERVGDAVTQLGDVGSPAGVLGRCAEQLGVISEFDIVLVTRIAAGALEPQALWTREDSPPAAPTLARLGKRRLALRYPLIEAEVAQRHEPALVSVAASGPRAAPELVEQLQWRAYAVADIRVEGSAVGLLHAARADDATLDTLDLDLAARYADGLGRAFERAVLREQLQRQRQQLHAAGRWIGGQTLRLTDEATPRTSRSAAGRDGDLADLLTPRELEVMRLVAKGQSNRTIAGALMLGEGTVKYHVKNILRKLQARNRAESVSRFMQLYGGEA